MFIIFCGLLCKHLTRTSEPEHRKQKAQQRKNT